MSTAVEIRNLAKSYATGPGQSVKALETVDLVVEGGAMVALTGPSGSGKSTLLHIVGAMEEADSGSVKVGGRLITKLSKSEKAAYRRRIGFVFQRFHLLPTLSVLDNVAAPLLPFKVDFDVYEKSRSLLASVGLADRAGSAPSKLSGGQQQRVAIARALVNDPYLLIADEPTGNLDSTTATEIMQLLVRIRSEREMTMLVATHDPSVAVYCDRILRMQDGRIKEDHRVEKAAHESVLNRISRLDPSA